MPYAAGDRVRLIKDAPVGRLRGPAIGAVGSVIGLEVPATPSQLPFWRVEFDDFAGQFNSMCRSGLWFVASDEIELLTKERRR